MRKLLLTVLMLCATADVNTAWAFGSKCQGGACDKLSTYIELDANGVWVHTDLHDWVDAFFYLSADEVFFQGENSVVISGFEVTGEEYFEKDGVKYSRVTVIYKVLARANGFTKEYFRPKREDEKVVYDMMLKDGKWLILGPVLDIHLYDKTFSRLVEENKKNYETVSPAPKKKEKDTVPKAPAPK